MKNPILFIMFFALLISGCKKDDENAINDKTIENRCDFVNFKYYQGLQDSLGELSNDYILIGVDTTYNDNEIRHFVSNQDSFDQNYKYIFFTQRKFKIFALKLKSSKDCKEITRLISDLEKNKIVSYANYTIQTDRCVNGYGESMGSLCIQVYGSAFFVKVFDENDLTKLNQMIKQTNTELIRQLETMPKWFELRATKKSKGDALKMANFFFESGFFKHSEPDMGIIPVEGRK